MLFLIILYIIVLRKFLKVLAVLFILIVSSGVVCAQENASDVLADDYNQILADSNNDVLGEPLKTFTDLKNDISGAVDVFEVTSDYKFDNATDNKDGVIIQGRDALIINGNGHVIDANGQSRIFLINVSQNIVINDLTFINTNASMGGALGILGSSVATNNVTFKDCFSKDSVIYAVNSNYMSNHDTFKNSTSLKKGVVGLYNSNGIFDYATFLSSKNLEWGFIYDMGGSNIVLSNSVFANTTSKYSTAVKAANKLKIVNTTFTNLYALLSAGAITVKKMDYCEIDGCTFVNVSSEKNGGALFSDTLNRVYISNSSFTNCFSGFGGAI